MIATLRLLGELEQRFGVRPASDLTFMFVIEEEMGENGSLALALDEQLCERYRTMMVLECCDGQVHPGGRGALWYRVEIPTLNGKAPESRLQPSASGSGDHPQHGQGGRGDPG